MLYENTAKSIIKMHWTKFLIIFNLTDAFRCCQPLSQLDTGLDLYLNQLRHLLCDFVFGKVSQWLLPSSAQAPAQLSWAELALISFPLQHPLSKANPSLNWAWHSSAPAFSYYCRTLSQSLMVHGLTLGKWWFEWVFVGQNLITRAMTNNIY